MNNAIAGQHAAPPGSGGFTVAEKKDILRRVYNLETGLPVPLLVQPFAKWYATADIMADAALDLARQEQRNREQEAVGDFTVPN